MKTFYLLLPFKEQPALPTPATTYIRHPRVPPPATRQCACGRCGDSDCYRCDASTNDECCDCTVVPKCFPTAAKVRLENGKMVKMSELQTGDRVQTNRHWSNNFKKCNIILVKIKSFHNIN